MANESRSCPDCSTSANYWQVHCRCGVFIGFPNWWAAAAERDALADRYGNAKQDAVNRSVTTLLAQLEELAERTQPAIAMSFAACDNILRSDKYRNYDQRIKSNERDPAAASDHSNREMVSAKLYPGYSENISYAVLSPQGRAPDSYGPIAVRWGVTASYLARRISLLEDNSFAFYDKHALGEKNAAIPTGYRAVWDDRAKLVVAKLGPQLTASMTENDLPILLLTSGRGRSTEAFIEVAIYADRGLDTKDVDRVTMQQAAATTEDQHRVSLVREMCAHRHIEFLE